MSLTIKQLEDMPPETVFARGEIIDSPDGINMTNSGKLLRWVAKRGRIHDWAIYCHFADKEWWEIEQHGDKVLNQNHIKKLVPSTDDALSMYRP